MDNSGAITVAGARIVYRVDGPQSGPALLLSNSLGMALGMWDPQMPALAATYHVVRYDSRGHGLSDAPAGPYTLERLGLDVLALLDALGIERAHLCGLSLGGMVAQWVALHFPRRVARVVLANTAARIGTEASWSERIETVRRGGMVAIRDYVLARFLTERFRREHPVETRVVAAMLEATPPDGYIGACAALRAADLCATVAAIQAPTLILGGALDESTPPGQARELHQLIAGSELEIFADTAHLSNVERAEQFSRRVLEFLAPST